VLALRGILHMHLLFHVRVLLVVGVIAMMHLIVALKLIGLHLSVALIFGLHLTI
jgi:hypothetical protein